MFIVIMAAVNKCLWVQTDPFADPTRRRIRVELCEKEVTVKYDDHDSEATPTAVVTLRIPCGADGDLVSDAEERLSRAEDIDDVTLDELYGIDPQRSATVITAGVTIQWSTTIADTEVRERRTDVPGLESIKRIG